MATVVVSVVAVVLKSVVVVEACFGTGTGIGAGVGIGIGAEMGARFRVEIDAGVIAGTVGLKTAGLVVVIGWTLDWVRMGVHIAVL
jgi:hypothetical protein